MKIVIDAEGLSIKVKAGCDAILEGYVRSLKAGGRPLVLAEREQKLGKLGINSFKPPTDFWDKLNQLPPVRQELAPDVRRALEKTLPDPQMEYKVVSRQAGLGQSWTTKICGDRRVARRLCRTRGEGCASFCLRLVEGRDRPWPVELRRCDFLRVRSPILSRSFKDLG
jgi:hypothetical protein